MISIIVVTVCVSPAPTQSYVEIPVSSGMVLGGGAFGRWLGHMGGALMNAISALISATRHELDHFHHLKT